MLDSSGSLKILMVGCHPKRYSVYRSGVQMSHSTLKNIFKIFSLPRIIILFFFFGGTGD
jgi:hypothetical protein